jgi:hypothetical protein
VTRRSLRSLLRQIVVSFALSAGIKSYMVLLFINVS